MLPAGTKLKGQWTVGSHLGSGACAEVYRIEERDPDTKSGLVVKCIPLPNRAGKKAAQKEQQRIADTLYYEYTLYTNGLLYGFNFAPKIPRGSYGEDAGHRYMVMEALDYDLRALAKMTPPPTYATIASIGLQILEGLQFIHGKGYVFVDIKPENFMIKATNGREKLYFIDFGLMEKITGYMTGGAQREDTYRAVVAGTAAFVSLGVHKGGTPSKRDDLEAMAYVLLSMTSSNCALPWVGSHIRSDSDCLRSKETCDIAKVCHERGCLPLSDLISLCRSTEYTTEPDYGRMKILLDKMRTLNGAPQKARREATAVGTVTSVISPVSAPSNTRRSSKRQGVGHVVDLVESPGDDVAPALKTAKRAKNGCVAPVVEPNPNQTPLLFDEPPVAKGRKTRNVVQIKATDDTESKGELVVRVLSGPHEGTVQTLPQYHNTTTRRKKLAENVDDQQAVCIGRSCDGTSAALSLLLPYDDYVSDSHAVVQGVENVTGNLGFRIKDLRSTNGTKLNKEKISADCWVGGSIGDTFRVGATTLVIEATSSTIKKSTRRTKIAK